MGGGNDRGIAARLRTIAPVVPDPLRRRTGRRNFPHPGKTRHTGLSDSRQDRGGVDMVRYTMFVLTNAVEGREDAFNEWYTNEHLAQVLEVPGFVGAQRFKVVDIPGFPPADYRCGATYDVEGDDPKAAATELFARYGTEALPASDT